MPPSKTVTTTARPEIRDGGYIPEELVTYCNALGLHVSMASNYDNPMGQMAGHQRYPLMFSEIDEKEQTKLRRVLTQHGFRQRPDGTIGKFDCVLYVQSHNAREAFLEEAQAQWARQNDNAQAFADIDAMNAEIAKHGRRGGSLLGRVVPDPDRSPSLSDHVGSG